MANQLKNETSPYLLQHADNPVDWYPWNEEALERARSEDRPILLSIGYSACHWCHVMAHESFENDEIASMMNEQFVNIKVDREERPDLDAIYMAAVQTMTGQGGWPMTVFLTPDGKPFYGGTYYPPQDRGGMPGFPRVLMGVTEAYRDRRDQVVESASNLADHLNAQFSVELPGSTLDVSLLEEALSSLSQQYDERNGGFGDAPKFPAAMSIDLLLRLNQRFNDEQSATMIDVTLDRMARGGLYDQVGGGFHRYTVDGIWLVPHFEKMLYDNALLAHAYTAAHHHTGEHFYRTIAEETLDFVLREMASPDGGFYSTLDADTEGEEGKFYVWTPAELREALGPEDGKAVAELFGVTDTGNFEGSNVLSIPQRDDRETWRSDRFSELRSKLYEARKERVYPGRDEKILTSWNGMMLRAFALAARVLDSENYRAAARSNAKFVRDNLWVGGRLLHSFKDGEARITGFLEDYAFTIDGLLELYQATFEPEWIAWARELADVAVSEYYDAEAGAFFDTSSEVSDLITRPREVTDNAVPSGNSVIAESLLRLSMYTGDPHQQQIAMDIIEDFAQLAAGHAYGLSRMLCAADLAVGPRVEIALAGPEGSELHSVVGGMYLPRAVIASSKEPDAESDTVALLEARSMVDGEATAYVCVDHACKLPATEPDELRRQIRDALGIAD